MKVFAIASAKSTLTPDKLQQHMPNEVPATLKLYLEGKVEQFWLREDGKGVIFLMAASMISSTPGRASKALSIVQLSGSISEGSRVPAMY